jgi:hypothetical protein
VNASSQRNGIAGLPDIPLSVPNPHPVDIGPAVRAACVTLASWLESTAVGTADIAWLLTRDDPTARPSWLR